MLVRNLELASALERLAQYLELDGADRFRTRAYRRAARSVRAAPYDVLEAVTHDRDPADLPGVGPRLAGLIRSYARSGHLTRLQELEARYPCGLLELIRIPGLGVRRVRGCSSVLSDGLGCNKTKILICCTRDSHRLDLDDVACRRAKELGVRVAISSDAHSTRELDYLRWGIDQARRGWLEPKDVVNTLDLEDLLRLLRNP